MTTASGSAASASASASASGGPGRPAPIRVLLVDDQELIRAGIALVLRAEEGIEIVGECADGDQVVDAVRALRPDIVLLDVRMARMDGIEAMHELARRGSPPPVLVLTTFTEDEVVWGAMAAGAGGFILKDRPADDIVRAIRLVAAGGSWIDPAASERLLTAVRRAPSADPGVRRRLARLSDRERQVLRAIARGAINREIAADLHVSERTVKAHVSSIFGKLEVRDRAAAIVLALDAGIEPPGVAPADAPDG
ncbi:Two component transcriptional regulator, LuxR family [Frankia canadensis]|uniref:Two component transcriptional regulator, LuxR family n=1 Tax=Frankia canadensis TaxID=1836972 RepID=A0A2I2L1J1_9ACTN|nr:response regulator transcription factor [Frankia canadensis]SNQ51793.1 Two component transcriptional regulator, LuxR family [Frankia canadensis]SOU59083.1 Two component transcriptional regulator, LuxR family [Frankia canadensis]